MRVFRHFVLGLGFLFLSGCATFVPELFHPISENPAVLTLMDQAKTQIAAGQMAPAGASLERALRIEPRNAYLWQELARVRLDQGQYRQAENLAAKSNSLARDASRLRSENWRIIAEARTGLGDDRGAQAAFERAR